MQQTWLQDNFESDPKHFFEAMDESNDLTMHIDPDPNIPVHFRKLIPDNLWTAFH